MAYLLLLALLFVTGITSIQVTRAVSQRSFIRSCFAIGFLFIGLGLIAQLALGFTLNETAAKIFYWSRDSMALAWFGQGTLILVLAKLPLSRWSFYVLIVASISVLTLVLLTKITAAQDWYSTSRTLYSQVGDLLATNRPMRWSALLLNIYGFTALLSMAVYTFFNKNNKQDLINWISMSLIVLGALGLIIPIYFSSIEKDLFFYLNELFAPVFLFVGLNNFTQHKNFAPR